MEIGEGLQLLPGDDGTLPVRARWIAVGDVPEAVAVDGDVVYLVGTDVRAFDLADGSQRWECSPEDGLNGSGGVVIGSEGSSLRVFAPWEYDLRVDRATGATVSLEPAAGGRPPSDFSPMLRHRPTRFRIVPGLDETVAYWPDGGVAWKLIVDEPFVDPLAPIEAGDAIIFVTSGQHLVVLDPAP